MICANISAHRVRGLSFGLFSAGLLIGSVGCSGGAIDETASDNQESKIGVAGQEMRIFPPNGFVTIINKDTRQITAATVLFEGTNSLSGQYYSDWQNVSGPLYGYNDPYANYGNVESLYWDSNASGMPDFLYESSFHWTYAHYSEIAIADKSPNGSFNSMTVTIQATIAGACHQDWEQINLLDKSTLYFDGNNATWDGNCWVGDLLHH